ncbi:pisatin demethylase [Phyllosticta paracitricarpa]|uniref:Pisatin demethylase n=1 Tax=Phyllosticta paracitricarpa TaxID=2016321 RepID=A0ABR1NFE4_9PEZI
MASLTTLLVAGLVAAYVIRLIRRYYALSHFKGPWLAGFSRLYQARVDSSGDMHIHYNRLGEKYGSTARIGPNHLLTRDPVLIKRMSAANSTYTRSSWYNGLRLHPKLDNVVSLRDEALHSKFRKSLAPGYSGKDTTSLEKSVDDCLVQLVEFLKTHYVSSDKKYVKADLARITTFFTLDVISTVAFGKQFGFMETNADPFGYIEHIQEAFPFMHILMLYPEINNILRIPFIQRLLPDATSKSGMGRAMAFAQQVVSERFGSSPVVRKDMLGSFVSKGFSKTQLESETLIQITVGSDSTASGIRMTLYNIATNPSVLGKLRRELDAAVAAGRLARPVLSDAQARRLPYLQSCVREGLRVFPPIVAQLAKQAPPAGDVLPDGRFVPAGTHVGWNSWGLMHDTAIFGPDADVFRPERWLDEPDDAKLARMLDVQSLVFGYGRFGCLGRPLASLELEKTLAELVLRFDWHVVRPDVQPECLCFGFFLHNAMHFRITEREMPALGAEAQMDHGNEEQRDFGIQAQWDDLQ